MQNEENRLLTAIYRRGFDFVRISFFMDDSAKYVAGGEITDAELDLIFAAQGGEVAGFESTITL